MHRLVFAALLLGAGPAFAQALCGQPREIRFNPGTTSAVLPGGVPRGSIDCYAFGARAGQRLEVSIGSVENNAVFQIYLPGWRETAALGPEGSPALPGVGPGRDATRFAGTLPSTGRYLLVVGNTRGGSSYRVQLSIR